VITCEGGEFEARLMSRVLEVSSSACYASLKRAPTWHALI
jgi:hypothetical protein